MGVVFKRPVSVAQRQAAAAQHHQEFQEQLDQGFDFMLTDLNTRAFADEETLSDIQTGANALFASLLARIADLEAAQTPLLKSKKK